MKKKVSHSLGQLHELFQDLVDADKLSEKQVQTFNTNHKYLVDFYNAIYGGLVDLPWDDEDFKKAWSDWKAYKAGQFSDYYKPVGERQALAGLVSTAENNKDTAIELIYYAMQIKTWRGIYPKTEITVSGSKSKSKEHESDY